ncbi:ankyrin repeat-containing domain protein [Aspergillus pseudonomiae]|nr:ankyrin repeat-containing domain protein [Aspergillus pseudonomiae]
MSSQEQTQTPQFGEENNIRLFGTRNGQIQTDCDDKDGRIALSIACLFGNAAIVFMQQTLAAMHYQRAFSSLVPSEEPARTQLLALVAGCTPLTCAAEGGHATVVQMLLENEEDVNERGMTEKEQSPIHLAALNGHVAVVKLLLERGANVEAQDVNMDTPLCLAVATCQAAVVDLLLEYKAKVNVRNSEGQTPLAILITAAPERQGTTAWKTIMQRLIAGGSDLEARVEPSGYTPLTLAASRGCVDIMEQLLEAGANTEARDSNNWTALFQAVFMGNPRMVKLLLDHKAKPDPLDEQQGTPLEYAVALGIHPPVFFQKTEIFDMRDGHYNIAQQILETRPLNHDPQDRFGRSLTWWIQLTGHTRMRDLLTDYGMQLRGDGQEQQGRYQLGVRSNKATHTCDICTMNLSRDNRGVLCGAGCEKYRICHLCCAFGASCEDFERN